MAPVVDAQTLALARQILGVQGMGVYACKATYAVDQATHHGQYTLATIDLSPTALQDGMQFRFVAPATAATGIIDISITGLIGFKRLVSSDGANATFSDVSKGEPVTVEYVASMDRFVPMRPLRSQVLAQDGSLDINSAGQGGGDTIGAVTVQPYGQGTIVLFNTATQSYWMCRLSSGGFVQNLFDKSAYVNGVPKQSLAPNTFHYMYLFNYDPTNSFRIALDFVPVTIASPTKSFPTRCPLGFDVSNTDPSRRFAGMLYTLNGGVGFVGSGNAPQLLVHSFFNSTSLPLQSGDIAVNPTPDGNFHDVPDAAISICFSAITQLPIWTCAARYQNANGAVQGRMQLKISGVAVADGVAQPINAISPMSAACGDTAIQTSLYCQFAAALPDGFVTATPQVEGVGGPAFFVNSMCDSWQ